MSDQCPVCRRQVHTTSGGYVVRHEDTNSSPCPMSGHVLPGEYRDRRVA